MLASFSLLKIPSGTLEIARRNFARLSDMDTALTQAEDDAGRRIQAQEKLAIDTTSAVMPTAPMTQEASSSHNNSMRSGRC